MVYGYLHLFGFARFGLKDAQGGHGLALVVICYIYTGKLGIGKVGGGGGGGTKQATVLHRFYFKVVILDKGRFIKGIWHGIQYMVALF